MVTTRMGTVNLITETLRIDIQRPDGTWVQFGFLHNRQDINWFESSESYWESTDRPIVGQSFEDQMVGWTPSQTRVALPHWFGHLLPEGMLRQVVAHELNIHESRDFQLMRALGSDDLPGALRAVAADYSDSKLPPVSTEDGGDVDSDESSEFKFSLAGVQLKYSVLASGRSITMPVRGEAGNAILKVPDPRPGFAHVPEAEHAAMELAALSGINVARTSLVDVAQVLKKDDWYGGGSSTGLLIDRFDRKGPIQRVHAEQLAQVLWISAKRHKAKYAEANFETIARLISGICGVESIPEVIDRIVFNALIGNGDAHLKNWSIIYPDGRTPILSPAYDIVPTVLYVSQDDLGLNLSGSKKFGDVSFKSFDRLGAATGFGVAESRTQVGDAVERIMSVWPMLTDYLDVESRKRLEEHVKDLPLLRESAA